MTLLSILLKASILLAIAATAQALARRRTSAAARHLIWTLAIGGLLLLPVFAAVLPPWTAVRLTAPQAVERVKAPGNLGTVEPGNAGPPARPVDPGPLRRDPAGARGETTDARGGGERWNPGTPLLLLYVAGAVLLLARLGAEQLLIQRLARRATEITDPEWTRLWRECVTRMDVRRPVRLLRSREQTMPMAFGVWRAAILLPAVADTWSEDRRRAVLLHELAHVARYDGATQVMASVACALYWVHPGVWWAARRFCIERELACDDRVLTAGTQAREYAGHLLELAYALGRDRVPALAVTMARPTQLEGRMLALLDTARNRTIPAIRSRLGGLAIMTALLVPIAAATASVVPSSLQGEPAMPRDGAVEPSGSAPAQSAAADASLPGTWEIRPGRVAGTVRVRVTEGDSSHGSTIDVAQLEGLPTGLLTGPGGPVQFSVQRDAGTFTFEGVIRSGVGGGTFTFTPSATFAADMVKRGFARPTAGHQRMLARQDIGFAFLDELNAQRYARPALADLIRMAEHGVNLAYLREMGALGYRLGRVEALVEQRDHGVTPEFIRDLAANGLKGLSAADLVRARDHGVNPEDIGALNALGHRSLDLEQLINLRDHGVQPDFIRELEQLGFGKLSLEALVEARNHGVSPEFAREFIALGYKLSLDDLTTARDHGVSVEYIRDLATLGYQRLPLDQLIRLRDHGVDPADVRALKALGYDALDIDDLVGLRDQGVTPDLVRRANARAGSRLSVERLKEAAARGWR